ncbi:hypothetical protein TrRE_jg12215, partial [Triparma retinervis]
PGTHQQSSVPKQRARPSNEEKPSHKRTKADNNELIEGYNPDDPGLCNLQSTFDYYSAQYPDLTDPGLNDGEDDGDEVNDGLSEYDSKVEQIPFGDLSNESSQLLPPVLSQLVMAMKFLGMVMQDAWLIYSLALVKANQNECPDVMKAIAASVVLAAKRLTPTVEAVQSEMSNFSRMGWSPGKVATYERVLRGTGVSAEQARSWTMMIHKELNGGLAYFLKWFLSPATVSGNHTASPFVALFILLSSVLENNQLPTDARWAEIFITAVEGLALARKCSVSLTTLLRFFDLKQDDADCLSAKIMGLWFFDGRKRFNVRPLTKTEHKNAKLTKIASQIGLTSSEEGVYSSDDTLDDGYIPDDGSLNSVTERYTNIKRDKNGNIVRPCRINGCPFEGNSAKMNFHRQEVHKIDVHGDGKKRNKDGNIIRGCSIDGCPYSTGSTRDMESHKTRKHSIGGFLCDSPGCNYKAGTTKDLKTHKEGKKHQKKYGSS